MCEHKLKKNKNTIMKLEDKNRIIESITDRINASNNLYLTDISDLNAEDTSTLRGECFKKDIELVVVKNTLLEKAFDKAEGEYEELKQVLVGHTSVMFADQGSTPAKLIQDFRKKHERPLLKAAYIGEAIYIGEEYLETLSNIKSREELIGDIVLLLQSPMKRVVTSLQSGGNKISGILETLSKKDEN